MRKGPHPLLPYLMNTGQAVSRGGSEKFLGSQQYDDMVRSVEGVKLYQKHPHKRKSLPYSCVHESNIARILKPVYDVEKNDDNPVLLIPSLINKSYILDLNEEKSFLRWLCRNNKNAYILDWNMQDHHANDASVADVIDEICTAATFLNQRYQKEVDLIGYCMGGNLTLGAATNRTACIGKIVLLATPWDFADKNNLFAKNVRVLSANGDLMFSAAQKKHVSANMLQALFIGYDPDTSLEKFEKFASLNQSSAEAKLFVEVEDWLNDGIDLPWKIATHCVEEWFKSNVFVNNKWIVKDTHLDLYQIENDILVVASAYDRLVPYSSAAAIAHDPKIGNITVSKQEAGHIGLIIGSKAEERVWKAVLQWL